MKNINRNIEHTNLKPTITGKDVDQLIREAKEHQFVGVCVPPFWVKRAARELDGTDIQLVTVIGFPLGYNMTETKMEEIKLAIRDGADELDIVMNVSAIKDGMPWPKIEFAKCSNLIHDHFKIIKVILETALLSKKEIELACKLCADAGVDYVKTSTGFASSGAQVDDVKLMRKVLPSNVGIKASGGIKTFDQAKAMILAGADRLGTSSGIEIMKKQ
ncbi:MAG: deoxyribose-phosphate aldolase [Fulvivirga sp.]|nr:deoxyribose-phosphate aldolase [Fulvivirga sp.]